LLFAGGLDWQVGFDEARVTASAKFTKSYEPVLVLKALIGGFDHHSMPGVIPEEQDNLEAPFPTDLHDVHNEL
jgi:hypothetical protein